MKATKRKTNIIEAAYVLSLGVAGWINLDYSKIALKAKCSRTLVIHYFSKLDVLKDEVLLLAITRRNPHIIKQGLICGSNLLKKLPKELISHLLDK